MARRLLALSIINTVKIALTVSALCAAVALTSCVSPAQQSQRTSPSAETRDVLRRNQAAGDDPLVARDMEFSYEFGSRSAARGFAADIRSSGFRVELYPEPDHGLWYVGITRQMTPTYDGITASEKRFLSVAANYGGKFTGVGFALHIRKPHPPNNELQRKEAGSVKLTERYVFH